MSKKCLAAVGLVIHAFMCTVVTLFFFSRHYICACWYYVRLVTSQYFEEVQGVFFKCDISFTQFDSHATRCVLLLIIDD